MVLDWSIYPSWYSRFAGFIFHGSQDPYENKRYAVSFGRGMIQRFSDPFFSDLKYHKRSPLTSKAAWIFLSSQIVSSLALCLILTRIYAYIHFLKTFKTPSRSPHHHSKTPLQDTLTTTNHHSKRPLRWHPRLPPRFSSPSYLPPFPQR
jgi:hypothetical protein